MDNTKREYIVVLCDGGYLGLISAPFGNVLDRVSVRMFAKSFTKIGAELVANRILGAHVEVRDEREH